MYKKRRRKEDTSEEEEEDLEEDKFNNRLSSHTLRVLDLVMNTNKFGFARKLKTSCNV